MVEEPERDRRKRRTTPVDPRLPPEVLRQLAKEELANEEVVPDGASDPPPPEADQET